MSIIDTPGLEAAVFIRLPRDTVVKGRGVDVDAEVDGVESNIIILRWSDAKPLMEAGSAELV